MLRGPGEQVAGWGGVGLDFVPPPALNPQALRRVAILGHSYVSRFNRPDPQLFREGLQVELFPVPGAHVTDILTGPVFDACVAFQPDLVLLIIGGNDITPITEGKVLANRIADVAREIEEKAGGHCKIVGVESRTKPRGMEADLFKRIKNSVNRNLRMRIAFTSARFVPMSMSTDDLEDDGIHLTPWGSYQLFNYLMGMASAHLGWE